MSTCKLFENCYNPCKTEIEALQQENEQLLQKAQQLEQIQAQLDSLRCTSCGEIPEIVSTDDDQLCEKCAVELDAIETINLMTYHNPADVDALRKAREEVQKALDNYEVIGEHEYDISGHLQEALAEIDKALGGGKDV